MHYKIAVGSRDGKVVTEHFGRCDSFLILDVDGNLSSYTFGEFRTVTPPCGDGEHSENGLEAAAQALSDCRIVLVSRIGPSAEAILRGKNIDALEYSGLIDDAMKQIMKYFK